MSVPRTVGTTGNCSCKVARVRVTLAPNPLGKDFRQEMDLATNSVLVGGRSADGNEVHLRVWVDAFQPVVHVEGEAARPITAAVAVECWRDEQARYDGNAVEWQHRNLRGSDVRKSVIEGQHLQKIADFVSDPFTNLTFGGRVSGVGMIVAGQGSGTQEGQAFRSYSLKTAAPTKRLDIRATLRIAQDATLREWQTAVARLEAATRATAVADRERTCGWWREFWDRSRIVINPEYVRLSSLREQTGQAGKPDVPNDPKDIPWQVGRNYQLFRAMLAANRNGRFPTLFNGGPFLCGANPDARYWGGCCFMGQNQRLVYWPMIKSGDDDLLRVGLDFYAGHAKMQVARAKLLWGIDGAIFPELMSLFGLDGVPGERRPQQDPASQVPLHDGH